MEQLNNNVIGEFFEKLGLIEEKDRDEFFKKIDEKHKVNLTQDLDLSTFFASTASNFTFSTPSFWAISSAHLIPFLHLSTPIISEFG